MKEIADSAYNAEVASHEAQRAAAKSKNTEQKEARRKQLNVERNAELNRINRLSHGGLSAEEKIEEVIRLRRQATATLLKAYFGEVRKEFTKEELDAEIVKIEAIRKSEQNRITATRLEGDNKATAETKADKAEQSSLAKAKRDRENDDMIGDDGLKQRLEEHELELEQTRQQMLLDTNSCDIDRLKKQRDDEKSKINSLHEAELTRIKADHDNQLEDKDLLEPEAQIEAYQLAVETKIVDTHKAEINKVNAEFNADEAYVDEMQKYLSATNTEKERKDNKVTQAKGIKTADDKKSKLLASLLTEVKKMLAEWAKERAIIDKHAARLARAEKQKVDELDLTEIGIHCR
mmetsp:Transcript_13739/g.22722  ORF Transcript_13739/g.22722 Transcript_13739/m.22722 type:complete len:348 (-) Transcript_13739:118-1161(-)